MLDGGGRLDEISVAPFVKSSVEEEIKGGSVIEVTPSVAPSDSVVDAMETSVEFSKPSVVP